MPAGQSLKLPTQPAMCMLSVHDWVSRPKLSAPSLHIPQPSMAGGLATPPAHTWYVSGCLWSVLNSALCSCTFLGPQMMKCALLSA